MTVTTIRYVLHYCGKTLPLHSLGALSVLGAAMISGHRLLGRCRATLMGVQVDTDNGMWW